MTEFKGSMMHYIHQVIFKHNKTSKNTGYMCFYGHQVSTVLFVVEVEFIGPIFSESFKHNHIPCTHALDSLPSPWDLTTHTTKPSTCSLAYPQPLMNTALSNAHALDSLPYKETAMFSKNIISKHTCTLHSNMPYRASTAHALHSLCIQDRHHISHVQLQLHCSLPQHNSLPMHINMHYTTSSTHPTA